jgi:hypothetical protein
MQTRKKIGQRQHIEDVKVDRNQDPPPPAQPAGQTSKILDGFV